MIKPIVIYSTAKIAALLYEDLCKDGHWSNVVAFTADTEFVKSDKFMGVTLVPFDSVTAVYPPDSVDMLVAVSNRDMRQREIAFNKAKKAGYHLPNFISASANICPDLEMGENNIVCGNVYIGPYCRLGNNSLIRPQSYVGHDTVVGDHVYISPSCSIGGYCKIGALSFLGIGSTVIDSLTIAKETMIGGGSVVIKDTEEYSAYVGNPARKIKEHRDHGIVL